MLWKHHQEHSERPKRLKNTNKRSLRNIAYNGCFCSLRPQVCHHTHGSYAYDWLIHHSSDVAGEIRKDHCWVGLLDSETKDEFYKLNSLRMP